MPTMLSYYSYKDYLTLVEKHIYAFLPVLPVDAKAPKQD